MAMSPLAAMLGGAFAPDDGPLAREPLPGVNPMAPQMLGPDLFAPDGPTAPDDESYDPEPPDVRSFLLPEPEAPDYSALLDPIRKEPGIRQRLMEAIIPLLAAGAIGKFGGGSQGAAGFLAGTLQGRAHEEELELEQAKLDASRRERALTREAALANQRWERTQKQTAAVDAILKQAAEFDDPAAAQAWLQSIAPTYARLGIDTTAMGSTVLPGAQRKLREAAEKQYTTAIDVQKKLLPEGEKFNPEDLHDKVSVTFRGKTMTLGELASIAGMGNFDPTTREATLKGAGNIENYVRDQFAAFEETTGRPPSRTERNQIVLEAQKAFAEAKVTPRQRALQDAQLQALQDRHNARTKGTGSSADWATKYSPQQQVAAGRFASRYVAASKEFAKRAEAYDTIMSTVSRADKSPQAQIALVFAYMKMLDPGSVVRETEYATAQNAAGVPERVRNLWNKVKDGRFLSKEQIVGMAREGAGLYTSHRKAHDRIVGQFAQAAMRQNIDPRDVLTDYNASNDPMRIPGVADTVPLSQDAEGNIAPVTPVAPTKTPGAAQRPTATQTQVRPPAKPKAGAPTAAWVGMPVLIDGQWKKVTKVHPDGSIDAY